METSKPTVSLGTHMEICSIFHDYRKTELLIVEQGKPRCFSHHSEQEILNP